MADREDSPEADAQISPNDGEVDMVGDEVNERIKVAVRIRPLNAREKQKESKIIVKVEGSFLWLTDPTKGVDKKFDYDFVYQSFDSNNCATNEDIFKVVNRWKGKGKEKVERAYTRNNNNKKIIKKFGPLIHQ
ncbi:hypothetical protein RFI_10633 [Reticulomyxa filosa]|uniref:Kinesin motor domain-containing protein n=1 Tax=Reticulomyxa filosa TaxID=46433 RepID=X6NM92_RETFI|nr:hypothetical protein RFI_10633 [Reticulomyxa filosa]|eukprot:ETO26502.1 hypothetical protein RFI_10633 [Reticulomyxa filosa]